MSRAARLAARAVSSVACMAVLIWVLCHVLYAWRVGVPVEGWAVVVCATALVYMLVAYMNEALRALVEYLSSRT